jgi:hypothetical protein
VSEGRYQRPEDVTREPFTVGLKSMFNLPDSDHAGKTGRAGSHWNWRTVFDPIDTTRPIAPYLLVRAIRLSLAIKFSVAWRIDGRKAVRS